MSIEIRVLGALEVVTPTGRLTAADFATRKAKQVFEVLAIARGRTVSKDSLVDTLWHGRPPQNPSATVELAVSLLRRTLTAVTDQRVVVTEPGGYRIDTSIASIDVLRFHDLIRRAGALREFDRLPLLVEAVGLVKGPLVEDEANSEWMQTDRDGVRRRLESARLEIARLALASGNAALAEEMAEAARLASDFVLEPAFALGIAALVQLGQRDEAGRLLRTVQQRLADEEGRAPSDATLALRNLLQSAPRREPSDRSVVIDPAFAEAPEKLPFLGRRGVLEEIDAVIARRLSAGATGAGVTGAGVTGAGSLLVSGPVGIGRSRLLAEVAARQVGRPWAVHSIRADGNDSGHEMLLLGRLMRSIAHAAKIRKQVVVEPAVATMFARAAELLDRLGPVVIVVDDFHLADAASQAVLGSLVAQGGAGRLCVVASARTPPQPGFAPLAWSATVFTLPALEAEELAPLGIASAWSESGGHPATLVTCCVAGCHGGRISGARLAELLAQVAVLGDMAEQVLAAAASLAGPFSAADVALRVGLGPDAAADVLHRSVAGGVLRRVGDSGFEFAGDVLRRALSEARTDPSWP